MAVVAGSAIVAGVTLTLAVPFVALHELIVKRHKQQMKRHLPVARKNVHFACEKPAKAAPAPLPLRACEEKVELKDTVVLPLPPYKSAIRQSSPPPAYDDMIEEKKVARIERPIVRFAQMA